MRRWDSLNERQLELLRLIAASVDPASDELCRLRQSAYAVRDRGLISIAKNSGIWSAQLTAAGRFYLDHGHHPDDPRHTEPRPGDQSTSTRHGARPSNSSPRKSAPAGAGKPAEQAARSSATRGDLTLTRSRRAEAVTLVEQLVSGEGSLLLRDQTEEDIARWRKVVDYARRNNLIPAGHRIEKTLWMDRLLLQLRPGAPATSNRTYVDVAPVSVPIRLRAPHPVVADLRDDPGRLVMGATLRRRCLLILQGLVVEATRRGHQVIKEPVPQRYHHDYRYGYTGGSDRPRYVRRDGELKIIVDSYGHVVTISEVSPQAKDPVRASHLVIELSPYQSGGRQYRWKDGKRRTVEDSLGVLLHEVETRAREDRQRQFDEERVKAERQSRWEWAMETARAEATEAYYASVLDEQHRRWRRARRLRIYRDELQHRLEKVETVDGNLEAAREWLSWIDSYLAKTDPANSLPTMPDTPELKPQDLGPYLRGWSPHGPESHLDS